MNKVIIQGTGLQKKIFYTALYHTMVQPLSVSYTHLDVYKRQVQFPSNEGVRHIQAWNLKEIL